MTVSRAAALVVVLLQMTLVLCEGGVKRAAPNFIGKRDDLDKRNRMFVGRRSGMSDLTFDDLLDDAYSDSDDLDKRSPMFVGKRNRMFVGKRFDEDDGFLGSEDKRAHMFIGKRGDENSQLAELAKLLELESSKRAPAFVGKRDSYEDEEDKRNRMFVGKKMAPSFVGKRRAPGFIGRRQAPGFIGKRNSINIVKRSASKESSNSDRLDI